MMMISALCSTNRLNWILIVLIHWHNSPRIDMSLHSDKLFWFRANQSLLLLLNAACLEENQQIPILQLLVWPARVLNTRSIALEASMLTITPICRKYQTKVFIMNYRFLSVVHFLLLLTVLLSRTVNVKNFKLLYLPGVATIMSNCPVYTTTDRLVFCIK